MLKFRKLLKLKLNSRGYTVIELMIVTAIIGIITPALTFLFLKMEQGMAADEMRTSLQTLNTNTMLLIRDRILANRHLFLRDTAGSGVSYLGWIQAGATDPPQLANYYLPVSQPAPATEAAAVSGLATFDPSLTTAADFGNCLFLAAYDIPQTIVTNGTAQAYYAPITVFGSTVTYSSGAPATFNLDLYRFYLYYLTTTNDKPIPKATTYRLVEWKSVQFLDYYELESITDSKALTAVVKWLATAGSVASGSKPITLAWDPTQSSPVSAFFTLNSSGVTAAAPTQKILEAQWQYVTHISSGVMSNGFGYGVASNNPIWSNVPAVPEYAAVTGVFPGGFEVGVEGTEQGREVLIRSLLVAKGGAPTALYNDMTTINTARDSW